MANRLTQLFTDEGFMPHGMCYLWRSDVLALHVISDAMITLAYFSIPFTLLYFIRKRHDLRFDWMLLCFAVFIVACGTTHLLEIWTVWHPAYWLSGGVKALTALASVPTAILLIRLVPEALTWPSPETLHRANVQLTREIAERERAEGEVRRINAGLEERVAERTAQLEATNRQLLLEVHQRQQAEEMLRSQQQLLQAIIDNSTPVIYAKDLEGRYLLVNRRHEEIFHLTRDEILGRSDYDLFEKPVADAFRAMDQRVLAADGALTEEETAPQIDGPHTYISVKAPLRDETGRAYGVFGISTDITERKAAEERLHAQLARLDLLDRTTRAIAERQDLRSILQVVLASIEDHLRIDFACVCLRGPGESDLRVSAVGVKSQARAPDFAMTEGTRVEVDQNGLARCLQGQLVYEPDVAASPLPFPTRLARRGLRALVIAPLIVESRAFGVMIAVRRAPAGFTSGDCEFLRQLTQHVALAAHQAQLYDSLQGAYDDLRQTQQIVLQQERLRALGQMASGIAHDINNALSPAALYVQSLLEHESGFSSRARESLAIIRRAIDNVADTVTRMREFCRPREPQLTPEPVDADRLLQQVLELTHARWRNMPQERGVEIHTVVDLDPSQPTILGAESEIRDAITNLVLNAVDAMPDGGTLTLRSRGVASSRDSAVTGRRVCIEVSDTGCGMSEVVKARCLEPFYTTKGERGTGLGLAMVYGMAQRHGAELEIESELGAGTTIRLLFPAASAAVDAPAATPPSPMQGLRLLIVDDDPLVLQALRDALAADGHSIALADGGQAAIDAFAEASRSPEPFAVVITDLGMPRVDGRTVAAAVKRLSPGTPVVLLTGWGNRMRAEQDMPEHIDRLLSKPPKLAELRATLAELATGQHAR